MPQVSLHSLSSAAPPPPPTSLSLCVSVSVCLSLSARSEVPQVSLHSLSLPPLCLSLSLSLSLFLSFSVSTLSMIFLSTSHAGWIPLTAAWLFQDSSVYHHEVEDWQRSRSIPCLRTDRCNMFLDWKECSFWDLDK